MSLMYAVRNHRPEPPAGVLRCPDPDPACACHDEQTTAPPAAEVARESGQPLDAGVRQQMERSFGHDFSQVRVHADDRAAASARGIDALAYSVGPHMVFDAGRYAPGTLSGQRIIAHELAHVVQRDGSASTHPLGVSTLEDDAEDAASAVAAGQAPVVSQRAASGVPLRQAAGTTTAQATTATTTAPGPQPGQAPAPLPDIERQTNVGPFGNVDAELSRRNALLTVQLKVKFEPDNSIKPWPPGDKFQQFVTRFINTVMKRWSFRHFLVPVGNAPGEPSKVAVRVQVLQVTSGEHLKTKVRYTDKDYEQSSAGTRSADLDQLDTAERSDTPQTPAEHEFGHMLGLGHISCNTNDDKCYGEKRTEVSDIMGKGSYVSPRDYEVFAKILGALTGKQWKVQQASYIPTSSLPNIGAGVGTVLGGLAGAGLGALIGSAFGPLGIGVGALLGAVAGAVGGFFAGRAIGTAAAETETQRTPS